jgi:16S rRNA (guanine527-N7)-methyltransferase
MLLKNVLKYVIGGIMEKFVELLKNENIDLSDKQLKQFDTYFQCLIEWNEKMNLTAITEIEDVYIKHFFDSILVHKGCLLNNQSILDVGSGAGFPSIPLKIIYPNLNVTIIDSLNKRISFLQELTKRLDIEATLIHGRAEEHELKNHYDIVTARAVSNLRVLGELCLPFVKKGGLFLSLKGPKATLEIEESKRMIKLLNSSLKEVIEYRVGDNDRVLIVIEKNQESLKKYPRRFNQIKANPL